ncbi:MAG: DUF501 domain-containing protein [Candidatus Bipolaricaulota bacterium]|nr:DUF501 domain-containing protein [Candidatus Bipolaricaulota bacterium]MDW8030474.1 DUF501 domain-containing protein [Candidatus Bipolaricaulota bacterium]
MDIDRTIIERQIGRPPRGVLNVEVRCPWGYPAVIRVAPLLIEDDRIEPFPTLFWLTCPILREQLARLEERGVIAQVEAELARDATLQARYIEDHRRYAAERFALLAPHERELLQERGWLEALRDRGIAGIADLRTVKCLHAHYAHHLARKSTIGRWLDKRFPLSWCPAEDIRCQRLSTNSR